MYPHSAQSKSKQSSQRKSQPPTQNDGGTGKVIRGTHIVVLFFVDLGMYKYLLIFLVAIFYGCGENENITEIQPNLILNPAVYEYGEILISWTKYIKSDFLSYDLYSIDLINYNDYY